MTRPSLPLDDLLAALRAAGEPTRLRILALLAAGDMTVKDMTTVLGQSQPRISRHLKLMAEAGLVQRFPEGAWVYHRLAEDGGAAALIRDLAALVDPADATLARDRERLDAVRREQSAEAGRWFSRNAGEWDRLRSLHVDEATVEAAVRRALGPKRFDTLVDLGTGTGRMLILLADLYDRAIGVDTSPDMLAFARANLDAAGLRRAQVRQGDLFALALPKASADVVVLHQVLHYLDDPGRALREAARVLRPGGRLLVVDFAPHGLEFLREEQAHRRLGFAADEVERLLEQAGLVPASTENLPATTENLPAPAEGHLTVTLWLARDPRLLVADTPVLPLAETIG